MYTLNSSFFLANPCIFTTSSSMADPNGSAWRNFPLSSACLPASTVETPIHSPMSCVHLLLGLPLLLLPSHVPSKNNFSNVLCRLMWPKYDNFCFLIRFKNFRAITSYSKLPAGRTISGVFFKNRHFSPIASVFLCGVFVLYCISLKLSESTVFNHVFLISFESKGRR